MIKRLFGMHHLNITQSRFSEKGSHKYINAYDLAGEDTGIDFYRATCDLEVIAILPYSTTKFANTVFFYDKENNVTLAMSHENTVTQKVGDVYHDGDVIYKEGTVGRASGNHIHLEIGQGLQFGKTQNKYGDWVMSNLLNIEDYFYLDESITVVDDKGINFEKRKSGDVALVINEGYNSITWNGLKIHSYLQKENQKIGIISSGSVARLHRLDDNRVHYCKVNAGYFGLNDWVHYGVEQGSILDNAPKKDSLEVVYLRKGSKLIERCRASEYWLKGEQVEFAMTPFATLYHDGDCKYLTTDYTNKMGAPNTQTFLVQLKSGRIVLNVCTGGMTPEGCVKWAKETWGTELHHVSIYDSGGSSQMVVNGAYVFKTERAIANCFTLYEGKPILGDYVPPETGDEDEIETLKAEIEELTKTVDGLRDKLMKIKDIVG